MSAVSRTNDKIALAVTNGVSTMWCAYIFAGISLTSLPSTIASHSLNADVQWVAQTFLQLVLLSVIMVGQRVQAEQTIALHDKVDAHHDLLREVHARG
jgi:hypothetical protein